MRLDPRAQCAHERNEFTARMWTLQRPGILWCASTSQTTGDPISKWGAGRRYRGRLGWIRKLLSVEAPSSGLLQRAKRVKVGAGDQTGTDDLLITNQLLTN